MSMPASLSGPLISSYPSAWQGGREYFLSDLSKFLQLFRTEIRSFSALEIVLLMTKISAAPSRIACATMARATPPAPRMTTRCPVKLTPFSSRDFFIP